MEYSTWMTLSRRWMTLSRRSWAMHSLTVSWTLGSEHGIPVITLRYTTRQSSTGYGPAPLTHCATQAHPKALTHVEPGSPGTLGESRKFGRCSGRGLQVDRHAPELTHVEPGHPGISVEFRKFRTSFRKAPGGHQARRWAHGRGACTSRHLGGVPEVSEFVPEAA